MTAQAGPTQPPGVITIPDDVLLQRVVNEAVLLNLATGTYYGLEEIGSRMLDLLLELPTIDDVARVMESEYDATFEELQSDILDLLSQLESSGLVRPTDRA